MSLLAKLGQVLLQTSPEGARDFSLKSFDDVAEPATGLHDLDGGLGHLAGRKVDLQPLPTSTSGSIFSFVVTRLSSDRLASAAGREKP
ncbi:hypothetical protein GR238_15550 [Rhizobium leguminosarum]|uniref:hypothetical protein n=1 Tax=Rhizobium ruizarguesonis TaxID=2081791 RepID=UPI0013BD23EF|nr:hypothetical protein [Rhizobium ruizarguesonis]NEJ06829.1 hypothetical protein [Rhizobium ruizarguesonis]